MPDYIERTEELILAVNEGARAIENTKKYHGAIYCLDVFFDNPKEIPYMKAAEVLRGFDELPAADVAPVRHGRWIYTGKYGEYECSVCHGIDMDCSDYYISHVVTEQEYCPNCGAKMDGGDD